MALPKKYHALREQFQFWTWLFLITLFSAPAHAEISGLDWESPQTMGAGILSDSSSPSAAYTPTDLNGDWPVTWPIAWHLVYVNDSSIVYRSHDGSAWNPPFILATEVGVKNPRLAFGDEKLHVVWEDERNGSPEVYTRRFDGSSWLAEECIACGTSGSQNPAIAGNDTEALLVYRQSDGLWARHLSTGVWGDPEQVAGSTGFHPSVSAAGSSSRPSYYVAWEDARHGQSEIYLRRRDWMDEWGLEERITDMNGDCLRPSLSVGRCCNDAVGDVPVITFENLDSGVSEVWVRTPFETVRISQLDGIPSTKPQIHHYSFISDACWWGRPQVPKYFLTWAEGAVDVGYRVAKFDETWDVLGTLEIEDAGSGGDGPLIATGANTPFASVLHLSQSDGVLSSRLGSELGCRLQDFVLGPALIVSPSGWPTTQIAQVNYCGGDYINLWWGVALTFDEIAEDSVTWDPEQAHPGILLDFDLGNPLEVSIRGGGCVPEGSAEIVNNCNLPTGEWIFEGVRSPDINGDCKVTQSDLDYVEAALGTDDFCADLDGSGWVDQLDVDIVAATFGDECSDITSVEDPALPESEALRISPQPGSGPFLVTLRLEEASIVQLSVHDAQGRKVRVFETRTLNAGVHRLKWDGLDGEGNRVSNGKYYLLASLEDREIKRGLVILR